MYPRIDILRISAILTDTDSNFLVCYGNLTVINIVRLIVIHPTLAKMAPKFVNNILRYTDRQTNKEKHAHCFAATFITLVVTTDFFM